MFLEKEEQLDLYLRDTCTCHRQAYVLTARSEIVLLRDADVVHRD